MLDRTEEALNQIAVLVDVLVIGDRLRPGAERGNDGLGSLEGDHGPDAVVVVALVGEQLFEVEAPDQGFELLAVVDLAARQNEAQRIAERIDDCVDLGAGTAARTPDRLVVSAPFLRPLHVGVRGRSWRR